jgi:outer membrane lipoprotein carrier protein
MVIFRTKLILPGFLALLLFSLTAEAGELTPQEMGARLQETYDSTTSFTADFSQVTAMKLSRRERHGQGSLLIKKPRLMRWDYLEPDRQVLISDGEVMSMYFAAAAQMIIMPAQEYLQSDVTYAFFAGTGNILRDFDLSAAGEEYCCGTPPDLRLTPKRPHPQVEYLYLWLNEDFLISRMQIGDHYGSLTDLTFTNIQVNVPLAAERFQFTPPPDTEIIRQ